MRNWLVGFGLCLAVATLPFRASAQVLDEVAAEQPVAETVIAVAAWIVASKDHRGLPFAVVDKTAAQVLIFDEAGRLKGMAPILLGSAYGDHSAPGVGERELRDIPPEERTTPAGRFMATYGPAAGGKTVLWVDYATALSMHPVVTSNRKERRQTRLTSPQPDDNRITFGCINVSPTFYEQVVRPAFQRSGVVYVLPEAMPLEFALPGFEWTPRATRSARAGSGRASASR